MSGQTLEIIHFLQLGPGSAWSAPGCFPEPNKKTENADVLVYKVLFCGVPETVLLVNRAFVPPEKGGF